ncbi:MAG TPA: tetratricopeptide repeat protein [Candidatus Acidoferrales bacterium]|nr:tetratricopeptide repeat protein [Candidatus Acidoferrales bacterium]
MNTMPILRRAILMMVAATPLLLSACAGNPEKVKVNYVEKGKAYMKKGAYSSAAIEFRNALKVDPKYVEAYYQLAQADMALRDGNGAYNALESAIEIDPNRPDARLGRAQIYLVVGTKNPDFYSKAEEDANYILKQDPQNAQAHHLLGSALAAEKKYDAALQEFSTVTKLEPVKASPYMDAGLVQMALQRFPDAEQSFRKAVEVEPKNSQAYVDLANFYRFQKKMPEAEAVLRQGAQNIPNDIKIYLDWAATLAIEGKNTDADATLKVLEDQSPKSVDVAIAIGDYFLQRNMVDPAIGQYQRGLSIAPKNLPLQQKLEDIYLTTNKTELAAKIDAEAMTQSPNNSMNKINHGRLLIVEGKFQDAVTSLQKTVADAADSNEAHYYLGMAYWKTGDTNQANAEFQNALRISPGLPVALRALAQLNFSQKNYSVAQIYAQELVQKSSGNPADRLLLGETLLQQGKSKDAEDQFLAAKQLAPTNPGAHVDLALLYQAEKKLPEAEKEYEAALQVAPQSTGALDQYAGFLVSRGENVKAINVVQQFLSRNPKDVRAHLAMSGVQLRAKNFTEARSEVEQALQLDPNSVAAYLQLGQVLDSQDDEPGALQAYQKALSIDANNAALMTQVGNIYMKQGDLTKATAEFQKAINADPNYAVAENNLAWIYAEQGQNLDVALGLAQKAKSQLPDATSFTDTLAWVMYKKGDYSEAIPYLRDCVKKEPESGQFRYHLGMALVAAGQKQQGKALLEAALRMNLDSSDSQKARQALAQEN